MSDGIITDQVTIDAPIATVWTVLTHADFYRQWDDLPEDFPHATLALGTVIEWPGSATMTLTNFVPNQGLKMSLQLPLVALDPADYDVSYAYRLSEAGDATLLSFEIGDFSSLPDAERYIATSEEFVKTAKVKIKELSEAME